MLAIDIRWYEEGVLMVEEPNIPNGWYSESSERAPDWTSSE